MHDRQNSEDYSKMWVTLLLNIALTKSSLHQFMLKLLEINRTLRNKTTETLEGSFLRLFITPMENKEGIFNPTDELLYRLKYLTLINPSLFSQLLYSKIIHFRALYMINKNRTHKLSCDDISLSSGNQELKRKYQLYSSTIDQTFQNEVRLNKDHTIHLEESKSLLNELKLQVHNLKANENNLHTSLYLMLKFGEFLRTKFRDASFEKVKRDLNAYSFGFLNDELSDMTSIYLMQQACQTLPNGEHENNLRLGCQGFLDLLNAPVRRFSDINNHLLSDLRKFIITDLIPNAASRKVLEDAINDVIEHFNSQPLKPQFKMPNLDRLFKKSLNKYFTTSVKNAETKNQLKESCENILEYTANIIDLASLYQHRIVSGKLKLALLMIFWINPLLDMQLNKLSIDQFVSMLIEQSESYKNNKKIENSFFKLFVDDLDLYGELFNPSDALLYRVKYLIMIQHSDYTESLYLAIMRCRALYMINETCDVKLSYNTIFSNPDTYLQKRYTQCLNLICQTVDKELRLNREDYAYLDKVRELTAIFNKHIDDLFKNNNLHDTFYNFINFFEMLIEKFNGKDISEIKNELVIYKYNFKYNGKPSLIPFALAKKTNMEAFYNEHKSDADLDNFYNGMDAFITLLDLDENEINSLAAKTTQNSLASLAKTFIVHDIIPNSNPRKMLFTCISSIKVFVGEQKEIINSDILMRIKKLNDITKRYFLQPVKNISVIQRFKNDLDEIISEMKKVTFGSAVVDLQWMKLINKMIHSIIKTIDVGTNVINTFSIYRNGSSSTLFVNSASYEKKVETAISHKTLSVSR